MVGVHLCKHTHKMGLTQVDRAFCQGAVNIIGDAHGEAVSLHKIDIVMFQPIGPAKSPLAESGGRQCTGRRPPLRPRKRRISGSKGSETSMWSITPVRHELGPGLFEK